MNPHPSLNRKAIRERIRKGWTQERAYSEPLRVATIYLENSRQCVRCKETKPLNKFYAHKAKRRGYAAWCLDCDKFRTYDYRGQLRRKVYAMYGNHCALCGNMEADVLTLDHKNRDGNKERRSYRGLHVYYQSVLLKKRDDLRVLCRNCNWREHLKYVRRRHLEPRVINRNISKIKEGVTV